MPRNKINISDIDIDSIDFKSIEFINTSYREYLAIRNGYLISVYPFATHIYFINGIFSYMEYNTKNGKFDQVVGIHHHDYRDGKSNVDPCDIFEIVCGIGIHHGEDDDINRNLPKEYYTNNQKLIESQIVSYIRENKINQIL